jgi:hypothetical protein
LRKIGFILFLALLSNGCSVSKNIRERNSNPSEKILISKILEEVKENNITRKGFFIQKAEIQISTLDKKKKILGSLKFEHPDKFLISLKSNMGIEFARIFISEDTLLINDRISRNLIYGSAKDLDRKFGISAFIIPLIIGDYLEDGMYEKENEIFKNEKLYIDGVFHEMNIKISIDTEQGKTINAILKRDFNQKEIQIKYDRFINKEDLIMPGRVKIIDLEREAKIEILFKRIEFPWDGKIQFMPGKGYNILHIL